MEEFAKQLAAKVGIDEATATKVVAYITENWDDVVKWMRDEKLDDVKDRLGGAVGGIKGSISGLFDGE
jgi:N-acetylglucosamine kinase-like BadF-type ATPase